MRAPPVAAIIEPAANHERIVHAAHVALRDAEAKAEKSERRASSDKADADRRRLELGRALVAARTQWPARGPGSGGWSDFLRKQGIEERSARDWMALAGHVAMSEPSGSGSDIPTRREVQAARRPKDETTPDPPPDQDAEDAVLASPEADRQQEVGARRPSSPATLDIEIELARLQSKLCTFARPLPERERRLLAHQLRQTATFIENMEEERPRRAPLDDRARAGVLPRASSSYRRDGREVIR